MCEIEIAPATMIDMADLAESLHASRVQWSIIRDAWARGEAWTLRAGGQLLGVAGIVPAGDGLGEAWFQFRPKAADHMLGIVRAIRLTISAQSYRAIVTLCTSEAGKRIARAAGFAFAEQGLLGEVWAYGRYSGCDHGSGGRAPEAPDAERAAHHAGPARGAAGRG